MTWYFYLGAALLLAYLLQSLLGLHWPWLERMQEDNLYKQCSGLLLALYLLHQWTLSLLRAHGSQRAAWSSLNWHKLLGVLAPLVFYLHATEFGYGYLFLLGSVYFANAVVGLCNEETLAIRKLAFFNNWVVTHVSLSVMLVVLSGYHVLISYSYE